MHVKQTVATLVRRMLLGLGVLALMVAFMGGQHGTASAWSKAFVRVVHASPAAGPVDVYVGGTTVITHLTYPHANRYLSVAPGSYTFDVTAVNYGVTIPLTAQLKEETVYSVFAVGLVGSKDYPLNFVIAAFTSENDD